MSRSSRLARPFRCGSAWRTSTSPDAYHPLSTAERNQQLSWVGVVSVQGPWPGFIKTSPFDVSYHWYRKPWERLSVDTSLRVARASDVALAGVMRPRSFAA